MKTVVLFALLASLGGAAAGQANLGTVQIYRIGKSSVAIPVLVDGQCKLKLSSSHVVTLRITPGEHQFESKFANNLNPVVAVSVEPGITTYIVMDYEHAAIARIMLGSHDLSQDFTLTLEHTNAPPEGKFKEEELDASIAAKLSTLPQYHEAAPASASEVVVQLADAEVSEALLQGRHTVDPRTIGLLLDDAQMAFGSALTPDQSVSGYTIRVYTAKQWIQLQASIALREMRPFSESDITPDLRQKLLHVTARPSTPDHLTAVGMSSASNVERLVLEEGESKSVLQPVVLSPNTVIVDSALRSAAYQGMEASFPQPDVTKPFWIVVIGSNYRKEFAVKDKHLARLR